MWHIILLSGSSWGVSVLVTWHVLVKFPQNLTKRKSRLVIYKNKQGIYYETYHIQMTLRIVVGLVAAGVSDVARHLRCRCQVSERI
jgi:hypothetical protein